jgi:hypothetical protein
MSEPLLFQHEQMFHELAFSGKDWPECRRKSNSTGMESIAKGWAKLVGAQL